MEFGFTLATSKLWASSDVGLIAARAKPMTAMHEISANDIFTAVQHFPGYYSPPLRAKRRVVDKRDIGKWTGPVINRTVKSAKPTFRELIGNFAAFLYWCLKTKSYVELD